MVDEQGNDVKPNVVGEFIIKSPMVMREYYKKPEETKNTIKNGWLYTGDLATIDEEGYITLVDLKNDRGESFLKSSYQEMLLGKY